MVRFDLDPSLRKVAVIAVLIFAESMLGGILIISQEGGMPTIVQWTTIVCVAALALVTYLLTFLRGES